MTLTRWFFQNLFLFEFRFHSPSRNTLEDSSEENERCQNEQINNNCCAAVKMHAKFISAIKITQLF